MISAGEFRKGITFEMNGEPHVILDFQHVKPGKGSPFVRTKYKNILTGATREEAFNPNDKFPKAHIETKKMQYLYNDGELYYFMDNDTFDQIPLHHDQVEEALKYLRENDFKIIEEKMVFEDGKYYPMMKAVPSSNISKNENKLYDRFGEYLLETKNPVLEKYLKHQLIKNEQILKGLFEYADSQKIRISELTEDRNLIMQALDYWKQKKG